MKKYIIGLITGLIIAGSIGVFAAIRIQASEIEYNDTPLDEVIDDLYSKTNELANKKICKLQDGYTANAIGAKYECLVGYSNNTEIKKYFYILAKNNNQVKLIMDRNISGDTTMITWMDAMDFFTNSNIAGGLGTTTKTTWTNVLDIDLPSAQDIANAVGNGTWKVGTKNYNDWFCLGLKDQSSCSAGGWNYATDAGKAAVAQYAWLFNYTRGCSAFGCTETLGGLNDTQYAAAYWTRDIVAQQLDATGRAWGVYRYGILGYGGISYAMDGGVRPVITVLQSNLY